MKSMLILAISLFSYSLQGFSKTIIVSDIDDTLKKANSAGTAPAQIYHFLKKIPYIEMRDLFNEIKAERVSHNELAKFYYVSAAQNKTFDADGWLQKYHFPLGRSTLKTLKTKSTSTYDFKYAVIKDILINEIKSLEKNEPLDVLMFGDNAQVDSIVYNNLTSELNLNSKIYIRDVRAEATYFDTSLEIKKIPGVKYYFSEVELFSNPEFNYLSQGLIARTHESYQKRTLVPDYTLKTLNRRLLEKYQDKNRAHDDALKFWNDYYSRF